MNKNKIIKIIVLVFNLFVCISGITIILRMLIIGEGNPPLYGHLHYEYLVYFTSLSNVYASIVAGVVAAFILINFKNDDYILPRPLSLIHLSSASSLALTALTVLCFLGPTSGFELMYKEDMFFYHLFNPILIVTSFILIKHPHYYKRCVFWGIAPMAIYGTIYSIMVLTGNWNDFYGFTFGGHWWAIFIALPIMLCVTCLISLVLAIVTHWRQK